MGFDDVAKRMKERGGQKKTLEKLWHGEELPLPPLPPPVPDEGRTRAKIAAYAVLLLGILIAGAAAIVFLLWFSAFDRWERRGVIGIGAVGAAIVVKATMMFDAIPDR